MADITWTDVTDHYPALTAVSANAQTNILAYVNVALNVAEFGGEAAAKTKLARIHLAAHMGLSDLLGATGATGPVTGESAGGLSRSYGSVSGSASTSDYGSTIAGQQYLALVRTIPGRAGILL